MKQSRPSPLGLIPPHGVSALLALLGLSPALRAAEAPVPDQIAFNRDVRPILSENCFSCHGFDPSKREGDLRLDLRAAAVQAKAIVPGRASESELLARISAQDPTDLMPPKKSHKKLSDREKEVLKRWIEQGAPYEKHWAFELPLRAEAEMPKAPNWGRNAVDAFVLAGLQRAGLPPAPEADRRTLARRLSLDLTGLPPSPSEVESFVQDPAPDAYEKLVQRLLGSPHWGEHRARYWLDAARYGDTHGIHHDAYREIWPYRDWVVAAYNKNMRFDAFTVEQLAGDLLPNPTREQLMATGFHRCNITTAEGGTIADENLAMYANDRVSTTSWVWLGLTANCAACHDHKFDPITQKDFYAMAAYFRNTTQGAMDGNIKDTKPVLYLPEAKDEKRFGEIAGEMKAATAALAERRRQGKADADVWAGAVTPEDFGVPSQGGAFLELGELAPKAPFSLSAWVKVSQNSKDGTVLGRMDDSAGLQGWELFVQAKKVGLRIASKADKSEVTILSKKAVITPDKEQHLLATYDGAGGLRLYADGKEVESDTKGAFPKGGVLVRSALRFGGREKQNQIEGTEVRELKTFSRALGKNDALSLKEEPALLKAVTLPPEKRSAKQKTDLADFFFRSIDGVTVAAAARLDALTVEDAAIRARATVTHVQEEKPAEAMANVLVRGAYDKLGEQVQPAGFSALHAMPADAPKNRLGLARWIVSRENPLTARVTVNRFWQELFGTGLVRTAEDFGSQGEAPANQLLLDWLALEFQESGWDVKKLFTLMVSSSTYRQAALATPEKLAKDPQNRLLSRGPRFRMDAEMIRDYALSVSGTLSPKLGGPGTRPYQPANVWEVVGLHGSRYTQDKGEGLYRRTLYNFWKRQAPSPNMEVFNAPTREVCTVRRERTNTPLQALVTLNDPQFVEAARRLAEAVLLQKQDGPEVIDELSRRVLLRPLAPEEREVVARLARELEADFTAHPERATAFLKVGDAKAADSLPAVRLATYGMIASQLLNLDETLNK
jgi:hypothetical protein